MEPASSSDDDSSIDEQASHVPIPLDENGDVEDMKVNNFDDLPSEDSCLDSDDNSSSDDDSDNDSDSNSDSSPESNHETEEMTLEDRIYAKQHNLGVKRDRTVMTKKSKALAIAQKRLLEMKRKKKSSKTDNDNDQIGKKEKKKKSKHAPTSVSSKRSAFYSRGAPDLNSSGIGIEVGANRYKPRDPRHQSLSGHFDQTVFEKRYDFLEKMQDDEIENLKQRCKAWKTTGKKGQRLRKKLGMKSNDTDAAEDQAELTRLLQERAARTEAKVRATAKRTVKKRLRDDVASGKKGVYYLKKREIKKLELEAKFEELKRIGGDKKVNEAIAKRRKKKMGRDSSLMPSAT